MVNNYAREKEIAQSYKGGIGAFAVISKTGEVLYSQLPGESHAPTYSIMLATAYGAAATVGAGIKGIVVSDEAGETHIIPARNLLVIANLKGSTEEKQSLDSLVAQLEVLGN